MTTIERRSTPFDSIKYEDELGEHWYARELAVLMDYTWRFFNSAINRARSAMAEEGYDVRDHFQVIQRPARVSVGKETKTSDQGGRPSTDYRMTRRACYFTAMCGDPKKSTVAAAQSYFVERVIQAERIEEALTAPQPSPRMPSHIEALRGWADALEAQQRAEETARRALAEVEELRPSAEAWRALVAAGGDCSITEAAAVLNRAEGVTTGPQRLVRWLVEMRVAYRRPGGQLVPFSEHKQHLRLRPITGNRIELRVTPTGLEWILQRLRQEQQRPALAIVPDSRAEVVPLRPRS